MRTLVCLCVAFLFLCVSRVLSEEEEDAIYSNSWAVEVTGSIEVAQKIAEKHGFVHVGKVRN